MLKFSAYTVFERALLGFIIFFVLMTLIGIAFTPHYLGPDVTLYTEIGQKMLDGQRPYVDYEENNFPMIHALYMIPALMTRITSLPPTITLQICLIVVLLLSLTLTWRLLIAYQESHSLALMVVFGMALVSWLMFNTFQWGQREHLFTLLYLPWLVVRVMRRDEKPIGRGMALTVGLMAGIGLAIKPYFALTGVLVEGVALLTTRRWYLRTPEVAGVMLVAGLHGLYFALNPDILRGLITLIQRLSAGYGVYRPIPWDSQQPIVLLNIAIMAVPFVLAALRYKHRVVPRNLLLALGAMGVGSMVGFLLQRKGWTYHAIPFLTSSTLTGLLLALEAVSGHLRLTDARRQNLARFVVITTSIAVGVGLLIAEVGKVGELVRFDQHPELSELYPLSSSIETYTQPGDRVMFVDSLPNPAFPMLARLNRRSASRYPMATPFPIAFYQYAGLPYTDPAHIVPEYMQEYLDTFVEDMAAYTPKLAIFRSDRCGSCSDDFPNLYDYMVSRGVIDAVIAPDYTLLTIADGFHIYVRNDLAPQP